MSLVPFYETTGSPPELFPYFLLTAQPCDQPWLSPKGGCFPECRVEGLEISVFSLPNTVFPGRKYSVYLISRAGGSG